MTKVASSCSKCCIELGLWHLAKNSKLFEEYALQWNKFSSLLSPLSDPSYSSSPLVEHQWQRLWLEAIALRYVHHIHNLDFMKKADTIAQNLMAELQRLLQFIQLKNPEVAEELWQSCLKERSNPVNISELSGSALDALSDYLSDNPICAHSLISLILPNTEKVLDLCFGVLRAQIVSETSSKGLPNKDSVEMEYFQEWHHQIIFLSILSLICLERNGEKMGDWLYSFMRMSRSCVPEKMIHFCLLTHSKLMLLSYLLIVHDQLHYIKCNNTCLPVPNIWITIGIINAEDLFNVTVKFQYHWMESLLDAAAGAMQSADNVLLEATTRWPSPLQRVLALLLPRLWILVCVNSDSPSVDNAPKPANWLRRLMFWQDSVNDAALRHLATLLERRAELAAWCVARGGLHCAHALRVADANASTLCALAAASDLSDPTVWNDARNMLVACRSSNSGGDLKSWNPATGYQWDVTVFDGFCILMTTLLGIQSSMVTELDGDKRSLQKNLKLEVLNKLRNVQERICSLFPLDFRVEVMESVFSLLFLQPERAEVLSDSESSVEEGAVEDVGRDVDTGLESSFTSSVASFFNSSEASNLKWQSERLDNLLDDSDATVYMEDSVSVAMVGDSRAESCYSLSSGEVKRTCSFGCSKTAPCACTNRSVRSRLTRLGSVRVRGVYCCERLVVGELLSVLSECLVVSDTALRRQHELQGDDRTAESGLLRRLETLAAFISDAQRRAQLFDGTQPSENQSVGDSRYQDTSVASSIVDPLESIYKGGSRCFVSQLLSPPSGLAVRCLAVGLLDKAQDVVKEHHVNSALGADIFFCIGLERVRASLRCGSVPPTETEPTLPTSPILQSVKQVATEGAFTAMVTKEVSFFLQSVPLPYIPEAQSILRDFPASSPLIAVKSMAMCDLALTTGSSEELSAALLALVGPTTEGEVMNAGVKGPPPGPTSVVCALAEAFRAVRSGKWTDAGVRDWLFCGSRPSVCGLLHSHLLSAVVVRAHMRFWHALSSCVELKCAWARSEGKTLGNLGLSPTLRGDVVQDLLQICSSVDINSGIEDIRDKERYLDKLLLYMTYLSSCICEDSSEDVSTAAFEEGLRQRVAARVTREGDVPVVTRIEVFSHLVRHNLVHSIARVAWPLPLPASAPVIEPVTWNNIPIRILNRRQQAWIGPVLPPERAVAMLLGALLAALGTEAAVNDEAGMDGSTTAGALGREAAARALRSSTVRHVLHETASLVLVDMSLLPPGENTRTFCTNAAMLLRVHALLLMAGEEEEGVSCGLLAAGSLERELAQAGVAYRVADAYVTLHALQRAAGGARWALPGDACLPSLLRQETADVRTLCLLGAGHSQAPSIQVLSPQDLDIQLNIAVRDCLRTLASQEHDIIKLPPMLYPLAGCINLGMSGSDFFKSSGKDFPRVDSEYTSAHGDFSILLKNWNSLSRKDVLQNFLKILDHNLSLSKHDVSNFLHMLSEGSEFMEIDNFCIRVRGVPEAKDDTLPEVEVPSYASYLPSLASTESALSVVESHCWPLAVLLARLLQEEDSDGVEEAEELLSRHAPAARHLRRLLVSKPVAALRCSRRLGAGKGVGGAAACALWLGTGAPAGGWPLLERLAARRPQDALAALLLLPERRSRADGHLRVLRHELLLHLAAGPNGGKDQPPPWTQLLRVDDWAASARCVLLRSPEWPPTVAQRVLRTLLGARYIATLTSEEEQLRAGVRHRLLHLQVLSKVSVRWAEEHPDVAPHNLQVDAGFVLHLLERQSCKFADVEQLLRSVEPQRALAVCIELVAQAREASTVHAAATFALDSLTSTASNFEMEMFGRAATGAALASRLSTAAVARVRSLLTRPLLLVEQLLMDAQFETLREALTTVRPSIDTHAPLPTDAVDTLLRAYAARALECRVAASSPATEAASSEVHAASSPGLKTLHQAVEGPSDTNTASNAPELSHEVSVDADSSYRPPHIVPEKSKWMPDYQATECFCCNAVVFSMFNRRHHCRRCGRLVCAGCSSGRMQVTGYGRVPVRVCDDCVRFTAATLSVRTNEEEGSGREDGDMVETGGCDWRLTGDGDHDTTIRGEFSYAHAPSAALCLAALSAHSDHVACPRFLVGAGEQLLALVTPVAPASSTPEVDPVLVLRMARALLVAAKLKFARRGLTTGESQCDALLRRADLLKLAAAGSAPLLPPPSAPLPASSTSATTPAPAALRALRDRLLALERWPLAVHVSTKAGLEAGSAWAAWGRACLRAGRWTTARDKFARVLQPVGNASSAGGPGGVEMPVLSEVLALLQSGTCTAPGAAAETGSEPLLASLTSLENVVLGRVVAPALAPAAVAARKECIHYLRMYAGPGALLSFLAGRRSTVATEPDAEATTLEEAVREAREMDVDPELFAETVYLRCAREGRTAALHAAILRNDPTLTFWQSRLERVAAVLSRRRLPNALYRLQVFCGDSARAALSCLRFYESGARSFTDLVALEHFLNTAENHLQMRIRDLAPANPHTAPQRDQLSTSFALQSTIAIEKSRTDKSGQSSGRSYGDRSSSPGSFGAGMTAGETRRVDAQLRALRRQAEVARFLSRCEARGARPLTLAADLWPSTSAPTSSAPSHLPTLLRSERDRVQVAVLALLSAGDIEEGFGVAFRIIQDFHIRLERVLSVVVRRLAHEDRVADVCRLSTCVQQSGLAQPLPLCDQVLLTAANVFTEKGDNRAVEQLAKRMTDVAIKISVYINSQQLKTAYLLAVQGNRVDDIRKIMTEAKRLGMVAIHRICAQKLNVPM